MLPWHPISISEWIEKHEISVGNELSAESHPSSAQSRIVEFPTFRLVLSLLASGQFLEVVHGEPTGN
jgi:hypothetical protein